MGGHNEAKLTPLPPRFSPMFFSPWNLSQSHATFLPFSISNLFPNSSFLSWYHPTDSTQLFLFLSFLEGQTSYPKHIYSNNPVISSLSHYEWFTADGTKTDAQFSVWWWYYPQGVERKVGRNIFRRVQRIDSSVWLYVWTLALWLIICAKTKLWLGLAFVRVEISVIDLFVTNDVVS